MIRVLSFGCVFWLANLGMAHAIGGTVENGGDTIFCRSFDEPNPPPPPDIIVNPPTDPEHGANPYTLDYIVALIRGDQKESFVEPESWSESADRLSKILEKVSPRLATSFHKFRLSTDQIEFDNAFPLGKQSRRAWIPWETMMYRSERGVLDKLPRNCLYQKNVSGIIVRLFVYQRTILRVKKRFSKKIEYNYYQPTLKKLAESSAQQYSFMMVHEWLWDHTKEIDVNRRVNAFLHKKDLEKMSPSEIRATLKSMGLKVGR